MDGLERLNRLAEPPALQELLRCCGSWRWAQEMARRRPYRDEVQLFEAARNAWQGLGRADWLEAFSHHPKIGGQDAWRAKFAATRQWARGEQSGVEGSDEEVLEALDEGNVRYEKKFGYIFIVCATGKSAADMLQALRERLNNEPDKELAVAAREQGQITQIRLEKLLK